MQSLGCTKFGCPLLISHVYSNLFSSNPSGSYFMGFQNNQVDGIRKGLFVFAFAFCFMIRAFDLMDLSQKEASVPFQDLLLTWNRISLHFEVMLLGTKLTKNTLLEAGHIRVSTASLT